MSFFSKLFDRLFRRRKQPQQAPQVAPPVVTAVPPVVPTPVPLPVQEAPLPPPAIPPEPPKVETDPFRIWETANFGGPSTNPAEENRRRNLWGYEVGMSVQMAKGPIPLEVLVNSKDSAAWLFVMAEEMNFDPRMLTQGHYYGEVSSVFGQGRNPDVEARNEPILFATRVNPIVIQTVNELAMVKKGVVQPWMSDVFHPAYLEQRKNDWYEGWKRVLHTEP